MRVYTLEGRLTACPTINPPLQNRTPRDFLKKLFLLRNLSLARLAAIVYREFHIVNGITRERYNKKYYAAKRVKNYYYFGENREDLRQMEISRSNGLNKKTSFTFLFDKYYDYLYRCQLGIILLPKK